MDSFVALADTTAQVLSSDLKANNFITTGEVSAGSISTSVFNVTTISAASLHATQMVVSTSSRFAGTIEVPASAAFSGPVTFVAPISASSAWFDGLVTLVSANSTAIVTASTGAGRRIPIQDVSAFASGFFKIKVAGVTAYVPYWLGT